MLNAVCRALIVTSYPCVEAHITVNNCSAVEFLLSLANITYTQNQNQFVKDASSLKSLGALDTNKSVYIKKIYIYIHICP